MGLSVMFYGMVGGSLTIVFDRIVGGSTNAMFYERVGLKPYYYFSHSLIVRCAT